MTTAIAKPGKTSKSFFTLIDKSGARARSMSIPEALSVSDALSELAEVAGFAPEPQVSTRYALLVAPPVSDGGGGRTHGEWSRVGDEAAFTTLQEGSRLRIAPQPRPAASGS